MRRLFFAVSLDVIYAWTLDGVRICFAGHLAGPLSPEEAGLIGRTDVLFLAPGGLSDEECRDVIARLRPSVVIPAGRAGSAIGWTAASHSVGGNSMILSREALPPEPVTVSFGQ